MPSPSLRTYITISITQTKNNTTTTMSRRYHYYDHERPRETAKEMYLTNKALMSESSSSGTSNLFVRVRLTSVLANWEWFGSCWSEGISPAWRPTHDNTSWWIGQTDARYFSPSNSSIERLRYFRDFFFLSNVELCIISSNFMLSCVLYLVIL